MKNGIEMNSEKNQMAPMTASVRCLVTRDRSGNIIAMYRSQEMADRVSTDDVKQVTA